jgi:hypothetical protein
VRARIDGKTSTDFPLGDILSISLNEGHEFKLKKRPDDTVNLIGELEQHDSLQKIKILGKYYTKESTSNQMWVGKVTQGD